MMLKSLKEDENSAVLWAKTIEDAKKGRMSMPVPLSEDDVQQFVLSPRFCVAQGNILDFTEYIVCVSVFCARPVRCGQRGAAQVQSSG